MNSMGKVQEARYREGNIERGETDGMTPEETEARRQSER
jgi:hypothetical protein